jgi:hypothetical protein
MYECGKVEILVANPFDDNVEFNISIRNINKKKTDEMRDILRMTSKNKRKGKNRIAQDLEFKNSEIESLVPMFFTTQKTIKVKKQSAAKLSLFYQPLTFEPHQAQIVFIDENIGELQHDIKGNPKMPIPIKMSPFVTTVDTKDPFDFVIPKINDNLLKAVKNYIDKYLNTEDVETVRKLRE